MPSGKYRHKKRQGFQKSKPIKANKIGMPDANYLFLDVDGRRKRFNELNPEQKASFIKNTDKIIEDKFNRHKNGLDKAHLTRYFKIYILGIEKVVADEYYVQDLLKKGNEDKWSLSKKDDKDRVMWEEACWLSSNKQKKIHAHKEKIKRKKIHDDIYKERENKKKVSSEIKID